MRTLCVAVRSVPEALWQQWSETLAESAAMETHECDALLEKLYDQMEREMQVNFSPNLFFFFFIVFLLVFPFLEKNLVIPVKLPDI